MADAFAKRIPSEMPVQSFTIEGDPLPQVWFVDVRGGVPILTVITDQSEDDCRTAPTSRDASTSACRRRSERARASASINTVETR